MKQTKYKNLYQMTYLPLLFPINAYIFEEDDYLTIIDVGVKPFVKAIQRLSKQLNKPIKYVVLTHCHGDHVGGLELLIQTFPDITFAMSKRESRFLAGDMSFDQDEQSFELKGGYSKVNAQPTRLLSDGDKIGSLEVIETRGHTVGSISLYNQEEGIMVVGDAIQTRDGIVIAGDKRLLFPFPTYATSSIKESIITAKRIVSMKINCLATGHGKLAYNPNQKIQASIKRLEEKINEN